MIMKKNKSGFTLIELLIVIAIIAILAAVIIATTTGAQLQARDARRVQEFDELRNALAMYNSETGHYPYTGDCGTGQAVGTDCCSIAANDCDYTAMATLLRNKGYLTSIPQDPLGGTTYVYTYCDDTTGAGSNYALMAKLETKSKALNNDYDTDWPAQDKCDCNTKTDDSTTLDISEATTNGPYTYCMRNP